ncbi:MAG: hypothetical protein H8K07_00055 [Nitrospira sp.]|nr:hypothetical protein [Nitrospira sp.]
MAAASPEGWAPVGAAEPVKGATESASAVEPAKVVRVPEVGSEQAVGEWVAEARDQRLRP